MTADLSRARFFDNRFSGPEDNAFFRGAVSSGGETPLNVSGTNKRDIHIIAISHNCDCPVNVPFDLPDQPQPAGMPTPPHREFLFFDPPHFSRCRTLCATRNLEASLLPPRSMAARGQFLLDYIELLLNERVNETKGFRHVAPGTDDRLTADGQPTTARGRERWVINKIRALCSWYSKGFDGGSHFRVRVNSCDSISQLHDIVAEFFFAPPADATTPTPLACGV